MHHAVPRKKKPGTKFAGKVASLDTCVGSYWAKCNLLLLLRMSCSGETNMFKVQNCFFQLSSKAGYTAVYITVNVSSKIVCLWRQTLGHLVAVVLVIRVLGH